MARSENTDGRGPGAEDRWISFGETVAPIPERLLLAHSKGEVIFITGAGSSLPANLPTFRDLVLQVLERLDPPQYEALKLLAPDACSKWPTSDEFIPRRELFAFFRLDFYLSATRLGH